MESAISSDQEETKVAVLNELLVSKEMLEQDSPEL